MLNPSLTFLLYYFTSMFTEKIVIFLMIDKGYNSKCIFNCLEKLALVLTDVDSLLVA